MQLNENDAYSRLRIIYVFVRSKKSRYKLGILLENNAQHIEKLRFFCYNYFMVGIGPKEAADRKDFQTVLFFECKDSVT